MEYEYQKLISPNLDNLEALILLESFASNYNYLRWDEKDTLLKISFINELSTSDNIILDNIVSSI